MLSLTMKLKISHNIAIQLLILLPKFVKAYKKSEAHYHPTIAVFGYVSYLISFFFFF